MRQGLRHRSSIILALRGSSFGELGQGIFKGQQIYLATGLDGQVVAECDAMPIAAPLCRPMSPGMIHENLSHGSSGNGKEMCPALPIDTRLTDELLVGLVNQCGRLKRMALSFLSLRLE